MRRASLVVPALCGVVLGSACALAADSGPVIVLPGRHGLPVILNGLDVTGAVLEGDWGLYSPHMVNPTVIIPGPAYQGYYYPRSYDGDGYYPALGHEPGYGRHEIEPPADRRLPPPAPSFHRSWSSASQPLPANLDPPQPLQLNVSPEIYPGGGRGHDARPRDSHAGREIRRP